MSRPGVTVSSLADLKLVKREIEAQALQRAQQAAELARARLQVASEVNLFIRAAGVVQPLPDKRQLHFKKALPTRRIVPAPSAPPVPQGEALSDQFDVDSLLETDEHLSFRRPGMGIDVIRKLRQGDWTVLRQLDLHGLRRDEARERLSFFIQDAQKQGIRCVRVVHGKGLGSPDRASVLKSRVHSWLVQKKEVLAFVQAHASEGGEGALLVLLVAARG
jgi:DNA-nicking Smr family endonuclease